MTETMNMAAVASRPAKSVRTPRPPFNIEPRSNYGNCTPIEETSPSSFNNNWFGLPNTTNATPRDFDDESPRLRNIRGQSTSATEIGIQAAKTDKSSEAYWNPKVGTIRDYERPYAEYSDNMSAQMSMVPGSMEIRRKIDGETGLNYDGLSGRMGKEMMQESSSWKSSSQFSGSGRSMNNLLFLIESAKHGTPDMKRKSSRNLRELAKVNDENRHAIAQAGGIKPLADLLRSSDDETKAQAVIALLNLSILPSNKIRMAREGIIEGLVEVLESGSLDMRENAAAAIFSLSVNDENKISIGKAGAIEPLVDLLSSACEQGKRDVCKAMFNLSIMGVNKKLIVEAGAVGPLVAMLSNPESAIAEKGISVLANLTVIPEGRAAIADDPEGIPALVETLEGGLPRAQENAAAALWQLTKNSSRHRASILQEVVIPPLVALSQNGTPRARGKAELLLADLRGGKTGQADP